MKIIDIQQGSPEWLALRQSKVGASDIAILMTGTDREVYNLFWEKFGEEKYKTAAMRRGSEMEEEARKWYENKSNISFERPVALHDTHGWLMASFDGFNHDAMLSLEIKCPNEVPDILESSKQWKRYYWQVQAQLSVGGHQKAVLLAYSASKQVETTIHRNEEDIEKLVAQGAWFHNLMQTNVPPPYIEKRDDAETIEFAEAAKVLKVQIDDLDEQWKIMREGGIYLARDASFECNGVKLTKGDPKVTIDYKAALAKYCPGADLSSFTKVGNPCWRLTVS